MKKIMLLLALAIQLTVFAQKDLDVPFLTKQITGTIKNAEIKTSGGSISVTAVNSSEARLEVFVYPSNSNDRNMSKEEIQKRLDELYELNIDISNNRLSAIAKSKERNQDWKRSLNIGFKLYVPKEISTDLTTSGGSISINGITGKQDFTTSGGSINVSNVSGDVEGHTSGGSINLENSSSDIELTTSGGSIRARNSNGKLRLRTSGGSVDIKDLKGDIEAHTSGGSISGGNIEGELEAFTSGGNIKLDDLSCNLETSTSGGNISITISELKDKISIGNSAGSIDLRLPKNKGVTLDMSAHRIRTSNFENFSGKVEDNEINGKLNGGGTRVNVNAGSGNIYLDFK